MAKLNKWRERKYSRRLTLDAVSGLPVTTTYSGTRKKEYDDYLQSAAWKEIRAKRLEFDKYKCTECGSGELLQVHHKTYARFRHEILNDLVTLCDNCHKQKHLPLVSVHPRQ